ncbi:MAG: LUD domain-containing protein [Planctomycetota bacterium]|nr:LUD domain-containing protein [Planctomycetota bacterium]
MQPINASRKSILNKLRSQPLPSNPLPEVIHGNWLRFKSPIEQLGNVLRSVGATCESLTDLESVRAKLQSYPEFSDAKRVLSQIPEIPGNVTLENVERPHDLEDVDFLIVRGEMAVAENGAVWVTDKDLKHRVAYFINQHLIMVVRKADVLHNMHEAYARVKFSGPGFGCFISGPSKTADIEQSLVIGAHGCRTMQLYIVD